MAEYILHLSCLVLLLANHNNCEFGDWCDSDNTCDYTENCGDDSRCVCRACYKLVGSSCEKEINSCALSSECGSNRRCEYCRCVCDSGYEMQTGDCVKKKWYNYLIGVVVLVICVVILYFRCRRWCMQRAARPNVRTLAVPNNNVATTHNTDGTALNNVQPYPPQRISGGAHDGVHQPPPVGQGYLPPPVGEGYPPPPAYPGPPVVDKYHNAVAPESALNEGYEKAIYPPASMSEGYQPPNYPPPPITGGHQSSTYPPPAQPLQLPNYPPPDYQEPNET